MVAVDTSLRGVAFIITTAAAAAQQIAPEQLPYECALVLIDA